MLSLRITDGTHAVHRSLQVDRLGLCSWPACTGGAPRSAAGMDAATSAGVLISVARLAICQRPQFVRGIWALRCAAGGAGRPFPPVGFAGQVMTSSMVT